MNTLFCHDIVREANRVAWEYVNNGKNVMILVPDEQYAGMFSRGRRRGKPHRWLNRSDKCVTTAYIRPSTQISGLMSVHVDAIIICENVCPTGLTTAMHHCLRGDRDIWRIYDYNNYNPGSLAAWSVS